MLSNTLTFPPFQIQFRAYLAEHGWDVSQMGLKEEQLGEGSLASEEIEEKKDAKSEAVAV